jgi:hypothetical protein
MVATAICGRDNSGRRLPGGAEYGCDED